MYTGGDQFVGNLTTALGNLRSGAKGQALVDDLTNSTSIVQIGKTRGSQTNGADPNGTYILWDPSSTTGGPDQIIVQDLIQQEFFSPEQIRAYFIKEM